MKNLWDIFTDKLYSIKDLGYVGSANIIGTGLSAFFWFYLASLLGAEDYGEIQYYLAIAGVVYVISSFGTPNSITVYAAKNIKINSTLFLISLVGGFIALLVLLGIFQRLDIGLIILGYIIFDLTINYLLGKKLYSKYSKYFLMQKILMLTLGFGFYYAFGLDGIIYGLAASYVPFTIIVYKICRESEINFSLLKTRSGFITNNYLESTIGGVKGEVDKLIIMPMLGFAILGNYALAMQFYAVLMIFSSVVFRYLLPQDSTGIPNTKLKNNTIFISIGIAALGITLSPLIISQFFPQYEDAVIAVQILSISVVPATVGYIYVSEFLGSEKSRFVLIGRIIALSTLVLGMAVLPIYFGIVGAASAFVLSSCTQTTFFILAKKKLEVKG
jgi:O-antigen/teichoic acid export membrane protein